MEFYAAERKKELLLFVTAWMELESIMLSEISQAMKDKYHMISPLTDTISFCLGRRDWGHRSSGCPGLTQSFSLTSPHLTLLG